MAVHSIVVPVFNEQQGIPALVKRLAEVMSKVPEPCEVVFVNDGSRDASGMLLDQVHASDPRFKVIHLSRNFGHQIAITAGLEFAQGRTVTTIDADLQDPPEEILRFIEKWREGFEVVYGVRASREGETLLKLATAKVFYRIMRYLNGLEIPVDTGDFRLMDRKVVDALLALPEHSRYIRGLVTWVGFKQIGILYARQSRSSGATAFTYSRMFRFAMDGITSFSLMPLRLASVLGCAVSSCSFLAAFYVVYLKLFTEKTVQGWTSLILVTLFLGGAQLLSLGIIGEYLGRVLDETRQRPLYFVTKLTGIQQRLREVPSAVVEKKPAA